MVIKSFDQLYQILLLQTLCKYHENKRNKFEFEFSFIILCDNSKTNLAFKLPYMSRIFIEFKIKL